MAIRQIRKFGDKVLDKTCREVKEMTPRMQELVQDMLETMYEADGVGLAAPQVGVLRRIAVVDVGERPYVLVNPQMLESDGEQTGAEGCLSLPGKAGNVTRPEHIRVRAFDENMQEYEVEATELLARAICHEMDHLDGILYTSKVEGGLYDVTDEEEPEEETAEGAAEGTAEEKAEETQEKRS